MFKLQPYGREGSDCTTPYNVILDKSYTVGTFINTILNERDKEWGNINIIKGRNTILGSCEYRYGQLLDNINDPILNKVIINVKASGGWTTMDYLIKVK